MLNFIAMDTNTTLGLTPFIIGAIILFFLGVRIIRPTHRGLIERLGKYHHFASPGFHWIIPFIDRMYQINTTEQMINAETQEIITFYNINSRAYTKFYFRITP